MARKRKDGRSTMTVSAMTTAILHGDEDLSAWSEEELIRGMRRSKSGRWSGQRPKVIPKAIHDELVRRKLSKAFSLLRDNLVSAVEVLIEIATDKETDPHARLKAAQTILHYVAGKPPEKLDLRFTGAEEPLWKRAIVGGIVSLPDEDIVDAEVVPTEKDDDYIIESEPVPDTEPDASDSHKEQQLRFDGPRTRPSSARGVYKPPSPAARRMGKA